MEENEELEEVPVEAVALERIISVSAEFGNGGLAKVEVDTESVLPPWSDVVGDLCEAMGE